jgi:ABC-type multidrug transport system fused ATPase/permease subunit
MTLAKPWPLKLVLDSVILRQHTITESVPLVPASVESWSRHELLAALCGALVAIALLEALFGFFQKILFAAVGQSATTDVLEHTFTHIQTLPKWGTEGARTGDLIVRLTSDIKTMRDLLVNHVQKLGTYGLTFLSTAVVMALMNWQLTAIALAVVPFIFLSSYRFSFRIRQATKQKRKKEGEVASIVQETVDAMAVVQAFAQEEEERMRFRKEARESLDAGLESARIGGAFSRSVKALNTIGTALVIFFGASRVLEGTLSPGDLVVFAAYAAELFVPIQNVSELAVQFMESLVSGERVLELVQTAPRIKDAPHAQKALAFRGDVAFDNVTFGYQKTAPVLKEINFRIGPGQTIALVGGSGAGKSSILNLLLRFYDPWQGRILIDGQDIRRYKLKSVRRQISVVLQQSILFRRSVRENIAYGRPNATMDDIVAAAKAAHVDEFISQMPERYNTMLDEQGSNLSGGQRQRIALARAFLRNAPIVILDEPTSGLDAVTEAQLSETLEELSRGRTTIIIAHRLSTIEGADQILVLRDGSIVQHGTHAELVGQSGLYREMYEAQRGQENESGVSTAERS